jgi:hypothetical protein
MPVGTKVHDIYAALLRQGADKGKAARIAQAKTGLSLATGKPPKLGLPEHNRKSAKPKKCKKKKSR